MDEHKYYFTIIIDTREQQPWEFSECATAKQKLDTGDYAIQGLESILCIERKKSVSEIANNITESRFKDVLNRMQTYQHKFILLEFDLDDVLQYPVGSNVPRKMWDKIKIKPPYILKFLTELQTIHNIHVVFCGDPDNAQTMAFSIMKRINELYGTNKPKNT